jgi:invasion protein IalB
MRFVPAIAFLTATICALAVIPERSAAQNTPGSPSSQLEEAERVWPMLKDTTNITVLESFATRYRDTFYAGLARARIDELKAQAAVPAPPVAQPMPPPPLPPPLAPPPPPPPSYSAPPPPPLAPRPSNSAGPSPPPLNTPPPSQNSAWVKLCETPASASPDMFGKRRDAGKYTCMTHHERLDGNTAAVLIAAGIRHIQGQPRQQFNVIVPPGMQQPPGMRLSFFPNDLWDKLQRNVKLEKYEEARVKVFPLPYARCISTGCAGEMEITPDFMTYLRSNGGLLVYAIGSNGQPIAFPVPLNGFREAYDGAPVDNARYHKARADVIQQIKARQKQLDRSKR